MFYAGPRGVGGGSQTSGNVYWQHRAKRPPSSGQNSPLSYVSGIDSLSFLLGLMRLWQHLNYLKI